MEINPEDKQVIDLLSKLKNSSGVYPSDILATRRQNYLKQVANVGAGIAIGTGLKNVARGGNGAATVTSKILETALIAAIAVEAGTVAYLYREKIADAIRAYTGSTNIQEVASPSSNNESSSSSEPVEIVELPVVIVTTPSGTVTAPSVSISSSALPDTAGDNNNASTNANVNATPNPNGNNGNQYGLTPKPVRTIDNGNGGGNDDGNDNGNGGGNGNGNGNGGGNGNNNQP